MRFSFKRAASLFMVVMLVGSVMIGAFAGGAAAATTTLAGDGTDTVSGFNASSDDHLETTISSDGTDFGTDSTETLFMNVTYDGEEYAEISAAVDSSTSSSQTLNMSHDQLDDLPGDAGEVTNVTVNTWGEGTDGSENTSGSQFNVEITFDNTYASTRVDDSSATIEEPETSFWSSSWDSVTFWSSSSTPDRHTYEQTVGIDGSNTTVTLSDATTNGSDAFDDAIDENAESGDLITGAATGVNGSPELAFYESADSDVVNTSSDTYFVYDSSTDVWTLHVGDDYSDVSQIDVYVSSQSYTEVDSFSDADRSALFIDAAGMSLDDLESDFGLTNLGAFNFGDLLSSFTLGDLNPLMVGGDALALGVVVPIGLKRRQMGA
jgi:hypothetical protein